MRSFLYVITALSLSITGLYASQDRRYATIITSYSLEGKRTASQLASPIAMRGVSITWKDLEQCERFGKLYADMITASDRAKGVQDITAFRCVDITGLFQTFEQVQEHVSQPGDSI